MEDKLKPIQIKGIKDGILVTLGEGDWLELKKAFLDYIQENEGFFNGAKLALDVGNNNLYAAELGGLRDKLSEKNIGLWAVISNSQITEQTSLVLGLGTRIPNSRPERNIKVIDTNISGEKAALIQRTLRSGYSINNEGHVIILGDVNPGAKIIAGGSVIIWGKLRGEVHAGCEGDEKSIICAIEMETIKLRIANITEFSINNKSNHQPQFASIIKGSIVISSWKNREGVR